MRTSITLCALMTLSATVALAAPDITRQDIHLDITGTTLGVTLDATVATDVETAPLYVFTPALSVVTLTVNGTPATLMPVDGVPGYSQLALNTGTPAQPGVAVVHAELSGTLSCADNTGVLACVQSADDTALLPSAFSPAWYFQNGETTDPFDAHVEVLAPQDRQVVAGLGAPENVADPMGGTRLWRFGSPVPLEYLLVYARPRPEVSSQGGFDVHGFPPDNARGRELMQTAVDLGSQLIPTYSEMYGAFPGNRVNLMTMPRTFFAGGLGLMGNVLLGEYIVGDLDYLLVQGTAHELAHTWWGGLASADPSSPHGGFMHEAMAEYSAWSALGRLKGDDTRTAGVRMNAVWYMHRRPRTPDLAVLDPNIQRSQLYVFVTYHKGSVVLRTLETMLGEAAFLRVLRSVQALGAGGLTPDAFINAVATEAGAKARAAAEAWLGTPGWPTIGVALERVPTSTGERVTATIYRTGDFPLTLPVHFVTEGGHRTVEMVEVTQESTVLTREFTQPVVAVEVDPTWSTLRAVEPLTAGDVNMDGFVDAADLMEVCLRHGTSMPTTRRQDGSYDPLYDVNADLRVDQADADEVYAAATAP